MAMLEHLLELRTAFDAFFTFLVTRAGKIEFFDYQHQTSELLHPFAHATDILSAQDYPTLALFAPVLQKL
ncbi:hypothetical protein THRCLA_20824 [Thraustotheca clavata]|uniref:Uncharacterized protein n=1 Tax=Thraustotheca clavata TaxID=74557 RepID=A0A1W0A386_9STRA|nr:hypothetical protein THRCLA_20824 [Thraustotheca clavata]